MACNLIVLLSHGFVMLLAIWGLIAISLTYLFFQRIVPSNFPFHQPVGMGELFGGLLAVVTIALAFVLIGSQTIRAAQRNPSEVLKSE